MKIKRPDNPDQTTPALPVKALPKLPKAKKTTNRVTKAKAIVPGVDSSTGRVDIAIALEMRLKKGMTIEDIAKHFNVSKQAVSQRLRAFIGILQSPEALKAYQNAKTDILSAVELKLVSSLLDADKIKDASLNNVAYALQNVFNMNRLEQDKSTVNLAHALKFEVIEPEEADS